MREAVAVVLMNDGEVFMVKRQDHLSSFPGYFSFPGGVVDRRDHRNDKEDQHDFAPWEGVRPELVRAALRELEEELGIDFKEKATFRGGLLGEATTPSFNPYRFKTWFLYLELVERHDFHLDQGEIAFAEWRSPRAFCQQYQAGKMLCVPPTIALLRELCEPGQWRRPSVLDLNLNFDEKKDIPMIEPLCGVYQFMPKTQTLPPATRTNAFLIGEILIDGATKDQEEFQRFREMLKGYSLKALMLTHHHHDHHQNVPQLARELALPLYLSGDTYDRLCERYGEDYFVDLELRFLKEGDVLTTWLDQDVLVYEVPGHDQGQLALAPRGLEWFLAGDLIQTVGTVVIAPPEGDMEAYFKSLERVIEMKPAVVFPSHGIGMGGTTKLEMTLKHRRHREQQVKEAWLAKLDLGQMLEKIYPDLSSELVPLARLTLQAHLTKIKKEASESEA